MAHIVTITEHDSDGDERVYRRKELVLSEPLTDRQILAIRRQNSRGWSTLQVLSNGTTIIDDKRGYGKDTSVMWYLLAGALWAALSIALAALVATPLALLVFICFGIGFLENRKFHRLFDEDYEIVEELVERKNSIDLASPDPVLMFGLRCAMGEAFAPAVPWEIIVGGVLLSASNDGKPQLVVKSEEAFRYYTDLSLGDIVSIAPLAEDLSSQVESIMKYVFMANVTELTEWNLLGEWIESMGSQANYTALQIMSDPDIQAAHDLWEDIRRQQQRPGYHSWHEDYLILSEKLRLVTNRVGSYVDASRRQLEDDAQVAHAATVAMAATVFPNG